MFTIISVVGVSEKCLHAELQIDVNRNWKTAQTTPMKLKIYHNTICIAFA